MPSTHFNRRGVCTSRSRLRQSDTGIRTLQRRDTCAARRNTSKTDATRRARQRLRAVVAAHGPIPEGRTVKVGRHLFKIKRWSLAVRRASRGGLAVMTRVEKDHSELDEDDGIREAAVIQAGSRSCLPAQIDSGDRELKRPPWGPSVMLTTRCGRKSCN